MLLRAAEMHGLPLAADMAALLSERDLLRGIPGRRDADIRTRLDVMSGEGSAYGVDLGALQRARRVARDLCRQVTAITARIGSEVSASKGQETDPSVVAGVLLAFAYPDRIGLRRSGSEGRYTLANGRGAHFAELQSLAKQELIVAIDLDDRERDARILLAAPLSRAQLEEYLAERLERTETVEWSSREQAVLARRLVRLDAIVLEEAPLPQIPTEAARAAMLKGIQELGVGALPWSREALELQARVELARRLEGDRSTFPVMSAEALGSTLEIWLSPWLDGVTRRDHLARLSLVDILRSLLSWEQQRRLDELAPTHLQVPSGSSIRINYLDESAPAVSVRLQEVFGLDATPAIGSGRVPITFKLLSPAQRPVQVTRDLASFWRGAYAEVRKDLRGRYPKHYWPEDPLVAEPVRGVRRRRD
jgi:ATP-dependent helicase HrpB